MSEAFLFKIMRRLVAAGLIKTHRGRTGGISLGKQAAEITLLDVVKVTEDNFIMAECFDPEFGDCPLIDACMVNIALRAALNAFFNKLDQYSVADLTGNRPEMLTRLGLNSPVDEEALLV